LSPTVPEKPAPPKPPVAHDEPHFGFSLVREAASQWSAHNAPRLGAALAYYAILSLAPTLVFMVEVFGWLFGEDRVRGQVFWQVREMVGEQSAAVILSLLEGAHRPKGLGATVLGSLTLLVGASGVFVELRDTLNYIWDVPPRGHSAIRTIMLDRFFSFAMVLGIGFFLAISLVASAILQAWRPAPGFSVPASANSIISFLITTFLFAVIYRVIPEVRVEWLDVFIGSAITAVLFEGGKQLIGFYLSTAAIGSAYGAAGSLVALLVWVYYSAQIFLYGAEFTHVYAQSRRPVIPPALPPNG
jgi:membrane protein